MMNAAQLLWGVAFGSIGLGYFMYGRKQRALVPLLCGVVLMVFPYFISNTTLLVLFGVVLSVLPYFVRR